MTYSVTYEVEPGVFFKVEAASMADLNRDLSSLGADFRSKKDQILGVINGTIPSPGAELAQALRNGNFGEPGTPVKDNSGEEVGNTSDPWGEPDSGEADDPWGAPADPPTQTPSAASSADSETASDSSKPRKTKDNYGREFTLNLPEAPTCKCGEKAAKMFAKGQKPPHRPYVKWVCARACGENWRSKCDYSEFPD